MGENHGAILGGVHEREAGAPLVSVLILTWNRRAEVGRSIESALAQTYLRTEVIVVDNGSSDGTADFVETTFPGVRLVRLPENLGCPSGRNAGFKYCSGRYIYQLDDDGWLRADAVERAVARAETDCRIGVVMSRIHEVEGDSVFRVRPEGQDEPVYVASFVGCCSMIRREALASAGLYPDDFVRQGEEADLALRMYECGYACVLEPDSVMFHKPSPVGRRAADFVRYALRNTNKTCLRLWPSPWCFLLPPLNVLRAARATLVFREPHLLFDVVRELLRDMAILPQTRRPISHGAFRLYRRLRATPAHSITTAGSLRRLRPLALSTRRQCNTSSTAGLL